MPEMGELEGVTFGEESVLIVMATDEALAFRRHQINAHQLLLLPVKRERVAIAVMNVRQQTIGAVEIDVVAAVRFETGALLTVKYLMVVLRLFWIARK